jgi:hypothetical protein
MLSDTLKASIIFFIEIGTKTRLEMFSYKTPTGIKARIF